MAPPSDSDKLITWLKCNFVYGELFSRTGYNMNNNSCLFDHVAQKFNRCYECSISLKMSPVSMFPSSMLMTQKPPVLFSVNR
jgi:hypothetical protein